MAGSKNMELKVYKRLAEIRGSMLLQIIHDSKHKLKYFKEKPEKLEEFLEYIANPEKWDHCGLLSKEQKAEMELLEHLLNDDMEEIRRYK